MGLLNGLKSMISKGSNYVRAKLLNGYVPIFSQFGQNVYDSDAVQNCIDVIATEISKLQPRHIQTDSNGLQKVPRSSLNRLFKFAPNELMTTKDFLEKVVWLLFLNYNVFIYPTYELVDDGDGRLVREYTGFYPLNPIQVDFLQDDGDQLHVKFNFRSGDSFTVPYSDVIHVRKKFSVNDMMGGGLNGQPDNAALLKVLEINHAVLEGLEKGIRTSLSIRGVLKVNTMMDDDAARAERTRFEDLMRSGDSGIMPMDLKGEYIPLNLDPKFVDKDTLVFLKSMVQEWYGPSQAILSRDYTDEQYQAFYESVLEPIVVGLGQAFSKTCFTNKELNAGNEVVFYQKDMMYLSTTAKLELLKVAGEQGLLTDNQKLALLGYPPIKGGNKRTMSLNFIDVNLATAYQMSKSNTTSKGDKDNDS